MNKKILTIMLATACYAPNPDLPSTYLTMSPVVIHMKRYLGHTDDTVAFERAAHNAPSHTLSRQEIVFDFMTAFESLLYRTTDIQQIKTEMESHTDRLHQEFPMDLSSEQYTQLVDAVEKTIPSLPKKHDKLNVSSIKAIFHISPIMSLAIHDTSEFRNNALNSLNYLEAAVQEAKRIKADSQSSSKQEQEIDIGIIVLQHALNSTSSHTPSYLMNISILAHEINNKELANIALQKALTGKVNISFNTAIEIAKRAQKIENIEIARLALLKAQELSSTPRNKEQLEQTAKRLNIPLEEMKEPEAAAAEE